MADNPEVTKDVRVVYKQINGCTLITVRINSQARPPYEKKFNDSNDQL